MVGLGLELGAPQILDRHSTAEISLALFSLPFSAAAYVCHLAKMNLSSVSHVPGAMKVKPNSSRVLFRDTKHDEAHWKGESGCVHPNNPKQGSLLMSFLVEAVRGNIDLSHSVIEMSFACVSPLPLLHRAPLNSSHSASSALHPIQ